jgi:hypothetical protein
LPTVHVTDQVGTALDGAFVQVYAPPVFGIAGGYDATETTDGFGNASFSNPSPFSGVGAGSSCDVIVNWTDPVTGVKYAGEGNWGVSGGFLGVQDFFTPDPLEIQLVTDLTIGNESPPGISQGEILAAVEVIGILFIVAIGVGITYTVLKDAGTFDRREERPRYAMTEP